MQLMPVLRALSPKTESTAQTEELFDPETNIELGQRYIDILLKDKRVKGDLFRMTTAWNAGPEISINGPQSATWQ